MFDGLLYCFLLLIYFLIVCKAQNTDYYACIKPTEDTNNITNCIAKSLEFPASTAYCDYCGRSVLLKCNNDTKWYRNYIINCISTPKLIYSLNCKGNYNTQQFMCPKLQKDTEYLVGTRTVCSCVSNCRKFVIECKTTAIGNASAWSSVERFSTCSNNSFELTDGPLKISFSNISNNYIYTCGNILGYKINTENNTLNCNNGSLDGAAPFCKKHKLEEIVVALPKSCQTNEHKNVLNCMRDYKTVNSGERIACTCKNNCRNVTLTCDGNDGHLKFEGRFINQICTETVHYVLKDEYMNLSITNDRLLFVCEDGYTLNGYYVIDCSEGKLQYETPTCVIKDLTTEMSIITSNNEENNTSLNFSKILYSVVGILVILAISLLIYLIYVRNQRRSIENNDKNVPTEAEAHYDYPVFNTGNSNEDPNYDYPVFTINPTLNQAQSTYEYVAMNELYASSTT